MVQEEPERLNITDSIQTSPSTYQSKLCAKCSAMCSSVHPNPLPPSSHTPNLPPFPPPPSLDLAHFGKEHLRGPSTPSHPPHSLPLSLPPSIWLILAKSILGGLPLFLPSFFLSFKGGWGGVHLPIREITSTKSHSWPTSWFSDQAKSHRVQDPRRSRARSIAGAAPPSQPALAHTELGEARGSCGS